VKQLQQHISSALKTLKEVEGRGWHNILLSSVDPINEGGEALKLLKIAAGYKQFNREYPGCSADTKLEVYAVLRAAYDNRCFPSRKHLSKAQFERLLMMQLERL
jgi:hypothetical protein